MYPVTDQNGKQIEFPICKARWGEISVFGVGALQYYINSGLIVAYNLTARLIFISFSHKIRFASVSRRTQMIFVSVLLVFFTNYGVLYILTPSTYFKTTISKRELEGVFSDYNAFWFNDIGYQVSFSMVIEAIFPVIELGLYLGLRWIKHAMD